MKTEIGPICIIVVSIVVLVMASVLGLLFGTTTISLGDLFTNPDVRMVLLELRLPRVLFAILVGAALALVGAAYQTLFRNPLASPFTLGVSSGAALGAALSLMATTSVFGVASSAMLGALVSISLILLISRRMGAAAGDSLLLVGIVFSFFCSSILTMLQYLSDYSQLFRVTRWMMGGIPAVRYSDLMVGVFLLLVFCWWLVRTYREFDLMLFGDDVATVKGASVRRLYYVTFILSSLVVGWIVSQCGVIGFVGIVVPAVARLLVGLRHRYVVPLSFVLGALLVVLCDLLGRVVRPPFEVPAGVFTAILGGPIFIVLALGSYRRIR
jgi:iron complex transport system permease protein